MDKHAPLITKTKTKKDHNPWFNKDSQRLKTQGRMAEKRWIKSKEHEDLLEYKHINTIHKKHLHHAKKTHVLHKLNDNKNKTRNLYNILRLLTKQKEENPMSPTESPSDIPNIFANFFLNKIQKIWESFHGQSTKKSYHRKCSKFTGFLPLEKEEILNIIKNMNPTTCIIWSLQSYISIKVQRNNTRCYHHHGRSVTDNRRVPRWLEDGHSKTTH